MGIGLGRQAQRLDCLSPIDERQCELVVVVDNRGTWKVRQGSRIGEAELRCSTRSRTGTLNTLKNRRRASSDCQLPQIERNSEESSADGINQMPGRHISRSHTALKQNPALTGFHHLEKNLSFVGLRENKRFVTRQHLWRGEYFAGVCSR